MVDLGYRYILVIVLDIGVMQAFVRSCDFAYIYIYNSIYSKIE